jgi:hypothetical protein
MTENLHKRFLSLVTLTQLISAINKGGYLTLRTFSREIYNPGEPLDDELHAIVNILMRDTEPISVAISGSNIIVVQGRDEDPMGESGSANKEQPDPAIVNGDQYKFPDGSRCILLSSGKSHLPMELLSTDELCKHILNEIK